MIRSGENEKIGVLLSGGLDSCILAAELLRRQRRVQPFYIHSGLVWQQAEQWGLERFLGEQAQEGLLPLVTLQLPLADLYDCHWSVTGIGTPDAESSHEAVFLPGRNALLIIKAALWCQSHGIRQLALATLGTSPFADATPQYFAELQAVLNQGGSQPIELLAPFADLDKRQVMQLGEGLPLEQTFSCISPVDGSHCGSCNKCAERRQAFLLVKRRDATQYFNRATQTQTVGE